MAQASPGHRAPMAMTVAELEAAIAALPGKRDALREAFDRLAACSPSPLPFAWEDLDGHISSLQSSIALQFRQLRVLEAAGAVPGTAALGGTRGDGRGEESQEEKEEEEEEEVVMEVEVEEEAVGLEKKADEEIQEAHSDNICDNEKDVKEVREVELEEEVAELEKADEEMQEANSNKICNDEKDRKETREVEVEEMAELEKKADEVMQESDYHKICNDENDSKEAREEVVEEEEVREAANVMICSEIKDENEAWDEEQTSKANEQDPDKEMQVVDNDKDGLDSKDAFKASQDKEEEYLDTNMDETAAKMTSSVQHKEEEACNKKQEKEAQEQDVPEMVEVAKNATDKKAAVANEVSSNRGNQALTCRSDMDAQRLVKLICTNTEFNSEFHAAARRAPDAAALALHVVELFLHNKIFVKTRKVWASCVGLLQMVPVSVTKPSANTIEQAKRVAKDWKEMIDNPESCKVDGSLASWGLLNFLVSYNIVTEFDTKEIFCLFGNISLKQKKKSAMLLKGLGLGNRIPELMDYLIENGQQMDVLPLARIFNMVDKYPLLTLLKGYVEKAKQTAMEVSQKNMTHQLRAVIIKELDNLRRAEFLSKKEITSSNLCASIREEINILLCELEKKKQSLADPLTASTSNSQQQQTKSKKQLKIEQKQEKKQTKRQQEQQQKQEDEPEEKKQKQEDNPEEKKQKQEEKLEEKKAKQEDKPEEKKRKQEEKRQQNKHQKWLWQHAHQLPTQGYPAMWNAAWSGNLERPPYAAMHGVHHGYPAQSGWPGFHCTSPFMPQRASEYIGPFTPLYPRPQSYPR